MCTKKHRIDFEPVKAIKDLADENKEFGYKAAIKFHAKTISNSKKITEEIALDILEVTGENKELICEQIRIEKQGLDKRDNCSNNPEEESFSKGVNEGIGRGILITLHDLYENGMITLKYAAQKASMPEQDFLAVTHGMVEESEKLL